MTPTEYAIVIGYSLLAVSEILSVFPQIPPNGVIQSILLCMKAVGTAFVKKPSDLLRDLEAPIHADTDNEDDDDDIPFYNFPPGFTKPAHN